MASCRAAASAIRPKNSVKSMFLSVWLIMSTRHNVLRHMAPLGWGPCSSLIRKDLFFRRVNAGLFSRVELRGLHQGFASGIGLTESAGSLGSQVCIPGWAPRFVYRTSLTGRTHLQFPVFV